jgi:predicted PurR-regulated permease PerM
MRSKIEIPYKTILFTLGILAGIWLVLEIRDILLLFFMSFIVMSAIRPMVERLERLHIPRVISIFAIYIIIVTFIGFSISTLIPPFIIQTTRLINNFPKLVEVVSPYYQIDVKTITQQIAPISENVFKFTLDIFSNFFTIVTILVFTFYLLLERKYLEKYLSEFLGEAKGKQISEMIVKVEYSLGSWLRGELLLMLCIGIFSYIGLIFLRVDYALPLAIIAGLMEIVPVIGPIISGVPAVLVAFTVSPFLSLATAALYFIIHQAENTFIVPVVMNRAVGLSPLITIMALMIGSKLGGPMGTILAIPIVVMVRSLAISLVSFKK